MGEQALLYDGTSALPFRVDARADGDCLVLEMQDGWNDRILASRLRPISEEPERTRIGRSDLEGWSLVLEKPVDPNVAALLPKAQRYGRWIDRWGLVPAAVGLGAITFVILVGVYFAPHLLAPHVPMRWERNLGEAMVGDFGELRCRDPEGQRALEALVERVAPGSTHGPDAIKVVALDVPVFNAVALPGGYIAVFKPAITETDPDALAGIVAHEVAHVRHRHVTESLIRELGIGAFIRLMSGEVGASAGQIVSLGYTRSNEAEADSDAIAMLNRAGISPKPTAELFSRLSKETGEANGYAAEFLQSHPLSMNRAEKFASAFDAKRHYSPALTRDQSDALFNICWKRAVK